MKNILKTFSLLLLISLTVSCGSNSGDDLLYSAQEERGWIQFEETNLEVIQAVLGITGTVDLGVNIQVPITSSDLTINYKLNPVSGLDPNTVFSNNGTVVAPAGKTSYAGPDNRTGLEYSFLATIGFNILELEGSNFTEPMVFDVELTATSSPQVTVGLAGETFPVTQRILVYPSIAHAFIGTYSVSEQFVAGPNAPSGLTDFFGESYQVELALLPNDDTGTKLVITNSDGFDIYFLPNTELTINEDGSLWFDDGNDPPNPVVALFRILDVESSSYNWMNGDLRATGQLGNFGTYRFILTKM